MSATVVDVGRRVRRWWPFAVLAVAAYLPALLSSPGRMPADTKLYLYLNPMRLLTDSVFSFDPRQFAGWVPHQVIAYLWPSGPWYVIAERLALPDWVAHRLWIGTIFVAAGSGVYWLVKRRLGLSATAALAAALVYQLTPFIVPYVSRTSSMLLPWASLGWIVGLTIAAATQTRWRHAAWCALVIASTGNVNATALAMIAPAPVLWLLVAVVDRTIGWRRAAITALRIGGLTIVASLWWIVMLAIQGRAGANLLDYSETLEDVSYTAASSEVWRALGYWLLYVRDAYAPTTSGVADYLEFGLPMLCGYGLIVVCLIGLLVVRWPMRRYALALVFAGVVLAVGVHPFDEPSPIAALLTADGTSGLALALRSSTRALPLLVLGAALGAAALVDGAASWQPRLRPALLIGVALLAVGNLPGLTSASWVDGAIDRDQQPPAAWTDAAEALDELPAGYRVFRLPGAEFGAFRWGYTVDPPLVALTDRPIITRDLLPLGSPAAMDLLYALDDRFQTGVPEAATVAPISRLFGADVIWLTGDAAFDRFRTPRPELVSAWFAEAVADPANDLSALDTFGTPAVNEPAVPMLDERALVDSVVGTEIAPVELVAVDDPVPIMRASDRLVIVAGSGDGLVDAAAASLITGNEAIVYSAAFDADELSELLPGAALLIVTDSNRRRAHHWRSSQDVTGYTESASGAAITHPLAGDARLPLFPDADDTAGTFAESLGAVTAAATSYGEPFSYQPEWRPANAVDGNPNTSWAVLHPRGQAIEISTTEGIDELNLLQPFGGLPVRHLAAVTVTIDDRQPFDVTLDERSLTLGQDVPIEPTAGPTTVRIELGAETPGRADGLPDGTPVGFAEIDVGLGASPEVVVVPTDLSAAGGGTADVAPVSFVFTRLRVDPTNRWRADPEWSIIRRFDVPVAGRYELTAEVRLDRRATDQTLADLLGIEGPISSRRLTGVPAAGGWAAADGDADTAWIAPFNRSLGARLTVDVVDADEPLRLLQPGGEHSTITGIRLSQGDLHADVEVPAPDGDGWSAIDLPAGFSDGETHLDIVGVDAQYTTDRRYGDRIEIPVAIAELDNVAASEIPSEFSAECRDDLVDLDGEPVEVRVAGSVAAAMQGDVLTTTVCGGSTVSLDVATHGMSGQSSNGGLVVDRLVLASPNASSGAADTGPTVTITENKRTSQWVEVSDCPDGCWLINGVGHHDAWRASIGGQSLGAPTLIAGGFNGWWLPPTDGTHVVRVTWTLQSPLTIALGVSAFAIAATLVVALVDRRRADPNPVVVTAPQLELFGPPDGLRWSVAVALGYVAAVVGFAGPDQLPLAAAGAAAVVMARRVKAAGLAGLATLGYVAVRVIVDVARDAPPPNPDFPQAFEPLHPIGMFAAVSFAVAAFTRRDQLRTESGPRHRRSRNAGRS